MNKDVSSDDDRYTQLAGVVADLAERMDGIAGRLAALDTDVERQAASAEANRKALRETADDLKAVADEVRHSEAKKQGLRPVCWVELDEEGQALALVQLYEWMRDVLIPRFEPDRRELPECWYRHPPAVEELSMLRTMWQAAWEDEKSPPLYAADWLDRWWPGVRKRIRTAVGCLDRHDQRKAESPRHNVIDDPDEFARVAGGYRPDRVSWYTPPHPEGQAASGRTPGTPQQPYQAGLPTWQGRRQ